MPRRKVPELEQSLVDLTHNQFLELSDAKAVELLRIQIEDKRLRARHALLGITFGTVCHLASLGIFAYLVMNNHPKMATVALGAPVLTIIKRMLDNRL
jgi:hypothetical protein